MSHRLRFAWAALITLILGGALLVPAARAMAAANPSHSPHVHAQPASVGYAYYPYSGLASPTGSAARVSASTPGCGSGVSDYHVVATYNMRRYPINSGNYRPSTLYCGNSKFGYRHLQPHIGQYFGGWGTFNFSITQVLYAPANITYRQANDTYTHSGAVYQCFPDYYVIWTFYVVTANDKSAKIITAYGSKGRTVNTSCP